MHFLSSRSRGAVLALFMAFGLLAFVTPADAQLEANIDIVAELPSGLAMPEGETALIPINITYQCATLRGAVAITVAVDANASGASASVDPVTFDPVLPPDCDAGAKAPAVPAVVKVTASKENLAGSAIPVTITVKGKNALDQEQKKDRLVEATAGPYFEATMDPRSTEFEIPAGERADFFVDVKSSSNIQIMVMPTFLDMPTGWTKPDTTPTHLDSPLLEDQNGTGVWQTEIVVPASAEPGDYDLTFQSYSHTMGDITLESARTNHTVAVKVTRGAGGGDGADEESPAPSVFLAAIMGLALLGVLRRRH